MLHNEARKLIPEAYDKGVSVKELAKCFSCKHLFDISFAEASERNRQLRNSNDSPWKDAQIVRSLSFVNSRHGPRMLFRTRYNVLFRQFCLLTAQAGSIPAAIRLILANCYKTHFAGAPTQRKIPGGYPCAGCLPLTFSAWRCPESKNSPADAGTGCTQTAGPMR